MVERRPLDLLQRGGSRPDAAVFDPGHRRHASILTAGMFDGEFDMAADALIVARSSAAAPTELYPVDRATGAATPLTGTTRMRLAALDLAKAEPFTFAGAGGTPDQRDARAGRPPSMPARKYPVIMLLHGGPQTQWGDHGAIAGTPQMFAAPGYVVVMINRRGSTGAGQKFTDDIAGDWGGKPPKI